ncbi:hypothetical protein [Mixta calida]|uniref:hypothetical protein n=1 Tax=Mixta calida TaxID=665913 RepID=UPI0011AAF5F5|nr:hypothetical protein [Mixta calida]
MNEEKPKDEDAVLRALSIQRKEFGEYFEKLEEKYGDIHCPMCKQTLWGVPPRFDSSDHAALVTLPLPNSSGRGVWAYPVVCVECGHISTFAAHHVSKVIRGG